MEAGISILKIKLDGSKNLDRLKNQENSKIKVKLGFTELAHFSTTGVNQDIYSIPILTWGVIC